MKTNYRIRNTLGWYVILLIPMIGTLVFSLYPLIQTILNSFHNAAGDFVGFSNYKILAADSDFRQSMGNTIYMGILGLALNIPIAFIVANMINSIPRAKGIYKTVILLPIIMSMVTVSLMFKFIFSADPNSVANSILRIFGMEPRSWFSDPNMSREMVVLMNLWKNLGYNVILFLAGLQNVPTELYEAADVDGAGTVRKWISITIPSMRNSFTFVFINMSINVLKRFTDVYAVGSEFGDPAGSLQTIMLYIYRNSFSTRFSKDLGAASAASVVLFLLIIIITIINLKSTENTNKDKKSFRKRLKGGV